MMTNLFSIFDPATPNLLSSNWLAILFFTVLWPLLIWTMKSRYTLMSQMLTTYLISEFKPLSMKSAHTLMFSAALFTIIMMNNVMGLAPYIFTASSHMSFTLTMALPAWLSVILFGWLTNTSNLLAHLIPQSTPTALMPFMVCIELISLFIRPLTLAVRLAANMIAGHLLIVLLSSATAFTPMLVMPILIPAQLALSTLELAVAFIQAYVFSVLITLYMAETVT